MNALLSEENLARARALVEAIQGGNDESASQLIGEMSSLRDSELFQNVGRLTRNLHDTVNSIGADADGAGFDGAEFPDARERLNHVIKLTEDSANTTLSVVEGTIPIVQDCEKHAAELLERWEKLCKKEMAFDKFRELSADIQCFLTEVQGTTGDLESRLNEVLVAQGFQDLTGQMIRQVIKLVDDIEERLVQLVSDAGGVRIEDRPKPVDDKSWMAGEGPQLPSAGDGVLKSQDEVDDLLASLGF